MNELEATAVLVALFALRCIAPLAITFAIAYLMNRLVDKWRVEDELLLPAKGELVTQAEASPRINLPVVTVPCWILKNCDEAKQAKCAARKQPGLACWLVRLRADGVLPAGCADCEIYTQGGTMRPVPALSGD